MKVNAVSPELLSLYEEFNMFSPSVEQINLLLHRPPDKSACWKTIFFISHPKHMLWVLK